LIVVRELLDFTRSGTRDVFTCEAIQPIVHIGSPTGLALLAVVDDREANLDLPPHAVVDSLSDLVMELPGGRRATRLHEP
jgi:hypothetical protein